MSHNLISACHKCKEQCFHFRNEEHDTILPFYHRHKQCTIESQSNVVTVMDNLGNDKKW